MAEDKPNRLGRGLSALLGEGGGAPAKPAQSNTASDESAPGSAHPRALSITKLRPSPYQPRRNFDETALAELTDSVKEKGVLQPILVRPSTDDTDAYEIVAGERRWRAAQKAGVHDVPVVIKELTDKEVLEIALIENVQRADLNPVEEARGYRALIDQFSYTQDELAKIIGKSRSHIANALRLLTLPEPVLAHVIAGDLSAGHARTLVGQTEAETLAERMISSGLSVRAAEDLVRRAADGDVSASTASGAAAATEKDPNTAALEREIENIIGLSIDIRDRDGKGEVRIKYKSLEQLDDLCQRLRQRRSGAAA